MAEKISPFDKYILLIDGTAEITINERKHTLKSGEGIIIPSHARHHYQAHTKFKMISTIIKSGYE
jgi:quercetin dioxygenase-like cupin family protein